MSGRERSRLAACVGAVLAAAAMANPGASQVDRAPASPDRPWQPRTVNGEIVPGPPSDNANAPQSFVLPSNPALANLPSTPTVDPNRIYDLADLIDLAESNDPRTRIAWNAAKELALAAGIARSTYLPRIAAHVLVGYQNAHGRSSALDLTSSGDTSASGTVSALSLEWLLFDFGQRKAIVEAADQATIAADIGFTAAHQQLIHDVSVAFYVYSAARTRAEASQRSLDDARQVQDAAEGRFKQGIGTVVEVGETRQLTAQARLVQVQSDGARQDAYVTLLSAMGIPPLADIRIADLSGHSLPSAIDGDIEKFIAAALGRRPDMLAAFAALKASAANERAARAEFLPKVFVSANTSYVTGDLSLSGLPSAGADQPPTLNLTRRRVGASIVGGFTVPLFDGGMRRSALEQAKARAASAQLELDQVRDDAVRQIVLANNALRTNLAAYEASGALLAAAQTTFNAALEAYRSGVGSSTDVAVAERQLLDARNANGDARSSALTAAATLALAAGLLGASPDQ